MLCGPAGPLLRRLPPPLLVFVSFPARPVVNHHHLRTGDAEFYGFLREVPSQGAVVQEGVFLRRLFQSAAGIVPAPHGPLALLLAYVLADIGHGCAVLPVQRQRRGEAQGPPRAVVDHPAPGCQPFGPLRFAVGPPGGFLVRESDRAGVHEFQARPAHEAVEMVGPVLVLLRYQDVPEPMAANQVVQDPVHPLHDGLGVVAVHLLPVQGEGDEMGELVRQGQPPDLGPGPAHTAQTVVPFGLLPLLSGRALGALPALPGKVLGILPPSGSEPPLGPGDDVAVPVGVGVHDGVAANVLYGFGHSALRSVT